MRARRAGACQHRVTMPGARVDASRLRRADRGRLPESTDTSTFAIMLPEAEEVQIQGSRALSVEDKLRVAESLRTFAWEVKRTSLAQRHTELSNAEPLERVRAAFRNDHS